MIKVKHRSFAIPATPMEENTIIDYIPEIPMGTLQIKERYSYAAGEWREPFAEAQVPYDELMGFAKFAATFAR
jgi:hypothetical protein